MAGLTVIFGSGAVGRLVAEGLIGRGDQVRIAQRTRPAGLLADVPFTPCDILDAEDVREAVEGAAQVLLSVGFAYDSRLWRTAWPTAMRNVIEACAAVNARVVWIDNLYQLGPQDAPRREDMALTERGGKPGALAAATRIWTAASDRVRFAALRCTDFYGPGVAVSHLGASALGELAKARPAQLVVPPDTPHDFAYVPDIARAALILLDAPDYAYGQAWNMPCAPTRTPRQLLQLAAAATGVRLRLLAVPLWLLPLAGLMSRFMNEVADVGFTWDRPYHVDGGKFSTRFGFAATPFEIGIPAAVRSFASDDA
ncbi:MAG TPA: NAD-dependent epimerase/dehydratase family protein [Caulobacteraceae bacterium]|jgi:nucleoside-diphosphate-sugar epimerase|nr:NAD-dependent epimerase/dehydratase family protein [Caulobacteraceae bacterium]